MERLTKKFTDGGAYCEEIENVGIEGINAPTYVGKAVDKLADYEDAEEQGLLKMLPCGIGDDVYFIPSKVNFDLNILHHHEEINRVYHQKVELIIFTKDGWYIECDKDREYGTGLVHVDSYYKETWFLTKEEAEQALKKIESEG